MSVSIHTAAIATLGASGTAQQITTVSAPAMLAYVSCPSTNVANIWIGDANVKASTKTGIEIAKGTTQILGVNSTQFFDANSVYFDGTTGDKASITYFANSNG